MYCSILMFIPTRCCHCDEIKFIIIIIITKPVIRPTDYQTSFPSTHPLGPLSTNTANIHSSTQQPVRPPARSPDAHPHTRPPTKQSYYILPTQPSTNQLTIYPPTCQYFQSPTFLPIHLSTPFNSTNPNTNPKLLQCLQWSLHLQSTT